MAERSWETLPTVPIEQAPILQQEAGEKSREDQENRELRLIVDDLFARYEPGTALEEASVIELARALLKRRNSDETDTDTLDQRINALLAQILKSKAITRQQALEKTRAGTRGVGYRTYVGSSRARRRANKNRGSARSPAETLEFWAPKGIDSKPLNAGPAIVILSKQDEDLL
jgi:hypothetical protein